MLPITPAFTLVYCIARIPLHVDENLSICITLSDFDVNGILIIGLIISPCPFSSFDQLSSGPASICPSFIEVVTFINGRIFNFASCANPNNGWNNKKL